MSAPGQSPSVLRDLQEAITGHLRGCSGLAGIEIYDRRESELETKIAQALAGANGLAIFVSPVLPKGISPNVPAICFDDADCTVRILWSPTTTAAGLDAYYVIEVVLRRLHHFTPGVPGAGPITADPAPLDDNSTKKGGVFDLLFHLSGSFEIGAD